VLVCVERGCKGNYFFAICKSPRNYFWFFLQIIHTFV